MIDPRLAKLAEDNGYFYVFPRGTDRYVALYNFLFTTAIISGKIDDPDGYDERWCYAPRAEAVPALLEWAGRNFEGEPEGWVRATHSGMRRRANGELEYAP